MIRLIWAMTKRYVIGKENRIPWHIKEDLVYFKKHTANQTVLMGENTYVSLQSYYKNRPFPYGKIYVASLNPNFQLEDGTVIRDVEAFVQNCKEDLWVIGGASIYKLCMPYADELYISWVLQEYEGDTYFPEIDFKQFRLLWKNTTNLVQYTIYERV